MIQVTKSEHTATVAIEGRLDFRCVKSFHAALAHVSPEWVVDMAAADYVDSKALGLLLLLREHAGEAVRVRIRHAHGQPRDVLLMAKFDRMFALED